MGADRAAVRLGLEDQTWSRPLAPDVEWEQELHTALDAAWPCQVAIRAQGTWDQIQLELRRSGIRSGRGAYGGWDDADTGLARAVCCLTAHLQAETVVETGVARGLTARFVLEQLDQAGEGHLSSIDLPPLDRSIHNEVGAAVPERLRDRWSYLKGSSRGRLPSLIEELRSVDLFIHDSLHTRRNLAFELNSIWPVLRVGGAVVADDIHRNDAFGDFLRSAVGARAFVIRHSDGAGHFGILLKGETHDDRL